MRIEERDGEFSGTIVALLPPNDPEARCERCEAPLKDRRIVGLTILTGLRRDGDGYSGGSILDPDEGRTYRCTARLTDGGRALELRGYIGAPLFGRTQVWTRAD